jgi:hypothetical protein
MKSSLEQLNKQTSNYTSSKEEWEGKRKKSDRKALVQEYRHLSTEIITQFEVNKKTSNKNRNRNRSIENREIVVANTLSIMQSQSTK